MLAHPERLYPPAAVAQPSRRRRRAAFTLIETMVALAIFIIGGLGVIEMLGLINNSATVDRALTAARMLVGAKIAKAQTDTWTPSNNVVPLACTTPPGNVATADPADAFDFNGSNNVVTVVGSTDTGAVITGTMNQYVAPFETASQSLLITYTLTFSYRGKTYSVSQSTVRAPDQL